MSKCKCFPIPTTPGPSSYVPSRLYPDFWNNLREDHIPMHRTGPLAPYDYPGPVPAPFAPVYAPGIPPDCLTSGMNVPPKVNRKGKLLVQSAANMPFVEVETAPVRKPVAESETEVVECPRPCPCPCPPPEEGFNPGQATTKVYRGTATLLYAGENVTLETEKTTGIIKYTVSSKDSGMQQEVTANKQEIKKIEEKLPELEVGSLTTDDIDDIMDLAGI